MASVAATGCASSISTSQYNRGEVGVPARVEPGLVVSVNPVRISGWFPSVGRVSRAEQDRADVRRGNRRGLNIVVRVERTSELISVVQADDEFIQPGARVWLEYGDRLRILPRSE